VASCPFPAPIATRIAVSFARETDRASSNPAAFPQAMKNSNPADTTHRSAG